MEAEEGPEPSMRRVCRTCLAEAPDMSDVFASGRELARVVMTCCDVKVSEDDGLPTKMCQLCVQLATSAYNFKNRCELADARLRSYLNSSQCQLTLPINIKIEKEQPPNSSFNENPQSKDSLCDKPNGANSNRQILECILCHSNHDSSKSLIEHVLQHHTSTKTEKDNFSCEICKREYSREFDLKKHQVSHKNFLVDNKINVCPICKEEFPRHNVLLRHMEYHIEDSFFECVECNCFFTTNLHLKKHAKKKHNSDGVKTPSQTMADVKSYEIVPIKIEPDPILDEAIIKSESVENDVLFGSDDFSSNISNSNIDLEYMKNSPEIDFDANVSDDEDSESNPLSSISKLNKPYKVPKKKKKIKELKIKLKKKDIPDSTVVKDSRKTHRSESSQHKKKFPSERSFLCSMCGKGYYKQNHLDKHLKTHTDEQVKKKIHICPVCGKIVNHSNHLLVHMRTHKDKHGQPLAPQKSDANKKLILCSMCGRSCSSRSNLAVHMRRHLGVMTSVCKICGKGYPRTTDLTLHMRQHTGERPFVCTHCNKGFARSDKLAIHMRIHTGEKPYTCQICGRSFAQSNDLAAHKKRNNCNVHHNTNSQSTNPTGNMNGLNEKVVYLSQSSAVEMALADSSSSPKTICKSSHFPLDGKSKKNLGQNQKMGVPSVVSDSTCEEEENLFARTRALAAAAAASNNLLVFSTNTSNNNAMQMFINAESMAARSMSDLVKQNRIPDILTAHQRMEYPDYNAAALFQNLSNAQSAHFDNR